MPTNCLSVFDHFVGWALKGLSAGTDLAINFDLVKCIAKNKYSYLKYNGKMEGGYLTKR